MKEFKPLKELVKALTYIGDAIAGEVTSNTQNTSNEYDGLILYGDNKNPIFTSSGIKNVEFSNVVKLGDIASKNLIDDLNTLFNAGFIVQYIYSKLNDNKVTVDSDENLEFIDNYMIIIKESSLTYVKFSGQNSGSTYTFSDSLGSLTENTVLTIVND